RVGAARLVVAVGVPDADCAPGELEDEEPAVLTGDDRVQLAEDAVDADDLAGEVAERVYEMDARLVDEQSRHRAEVGLPVQVGPGPPSVSRPGVERQGV